MALLALLNPTGPVCTHHPVSLKHKSTVTLSIKSKQFILNTQCLFLKSCFMGHMIKYLTWYLAYGHKYSWTCCVCLCVPESDFCFMKFTLARKVIFVDAARPSGACYSKFDGFIYT